MIFFILYYFLFFNLFFFFFNDTATTEIYTLSLHDALPSRGLPGWGELGDQVIPTRGQDGTALPGPGHEGDAGGPEHDGGIVVDAIEGRRKGQQPGQGQGEMPVQARKLRLLSGGCGRGQLVQQREQGGQLALPSCRVERAGRRQDDDLQELVQGRRQEAERVGGGPSLGARRAVGDQIGPGVASQGASTGGDPSRLTLDAGR